MKAWLTFEIDFNDCTILSHTSYSTPEISHNDYGYDSYSHSRRLDRRNVSHRSLIRWMKEIDGRLQIFESEPFGIDEKTLHMKILIQEKGSIKVNKNDYSDYVFDLDFLDT